MPELFTVPAVVKNHSIDMDVSMAKGSRYTYQALLNAIATGNHLGIGRTVVKCENASDGIERIDLIRRDLFRPETVLPLEFPKSLSVNTGYESDLAYEIDEFTSIRLSGLKKKVKIQVDSTS